MEKFYKVLKDNFLWSKGAILKQDKNTGREAKCYGYQTISDVWDTTDHNDNEYISGAIIENNPEWFVRVYPINLVSKTVYKLKEEAKTLMAKEHSA